MHHWCLQRQVIQSNINQTQQELKEGLRNFQLVVVHQWRIYDNQKTPGLHAECAFKAIWHTHTACPVRLFCLSASMMEPAPAWEITSDALDIWRQTKQNTLTRHHTTIRPLHILTSCTFTASSSKLGLRSNDLWSQVKTSTKLYWQFPWGKWDDSFVWTCQFSSWWKGWSRSLISTSLSAALYLQNRWISLAQPSNEPGILVEGSLWKQVLHLWLPRPRWTTRRL